MGNVLKFDIIDYNSRHPKSRWGHQVPQSLGEEMDAASDEMMKLNDEMMKVMEKISSLRDEIIKLECSCKICVEEKELKKLNEEM